MSKSKAEVQYAGKLVDFKPKKYSLKKYMTTIGIDPTCELALPNFLERISRKHAQILKEKDGFYIKDLRSSNGTWINEKRLEKERIKLNDGDNIILAKKALGEDFYSFVFRVK